MLALAPMMRIFVLLIVQQLIQFSRVINFLLFGLVMRDINVSIIYNTANIFKGFEKAIILLPRS